jgi:hypothetical protein
MKDAMIGCVLWETVPQDCADRHLILGAAFQEAEDGAIHVVQRYRSRNANLRTQLLRIIARSGLSAWPRLFHNLRASRATELANEFPIHVVCEWIGNSPDVARRHYL